MKYKNICKFIEETDTRDLFTKRFVCERTPAAMRNPITAKMYRAVLLSEGECTFYVGEESYLLEKGDMIFMFAGETFFAEPDEKEKCEYFYIDFGGIRSEALMKRFGIDNTDRVRREHEGLIPFWRDAIARAADSNIDLVAESVLLYSFSDLAELSAKEDSVAARAAEMVDELFADPSLNLESIAKRLGYNQKYLSHNFKQKMGIGFTEYLRNARIRQAVFLMEHGLESVKNVSYLCGFEDPLYFSGVFKKVVGIPPAAYMKRLKDKNV